MKVFWLEVPLPGSLRLNPPLGDSPPPAENANTVVASGCASFTTVIRPAAGVALMNVHVTDLPAAMKRFGAMLPFEQFDWSRSNPLGVDCATW